MDPTSQYPPNPSTTAQASLRHLRTLATYELIARYKALWGRQPRSRHRAWLMKRIAWKAEEIRLGGLSHLALQRINALIAEMGIHFPGPPPVLPGEQPHSPADPIHGSSLCRIWHDQEYRTTRVEGGWEFEDTIYPSLSALARHITGARWSGRRFFGLTQRRRSGR